VEHPDIGFPIGPDPILYVDRCKSEGKDVIAVCGKLQLSPTLPVGDRPFDLQ
jgi:hypothetical protein